MQEQVGSGHVSDSGKAPLGRSCRAADPLKVPIDPNGNLTTKTEGTDTWGYFWSAENQLTKVEKNGVEVARFAYDPLGGRVEKVAGGVTTSYTHDADTILREIRGTATLKYVHGPGADEPLAQEDALAQLSFYHTDGLNSVLKRTNQAGAVIHEYEYDAWGSIAAGAAEPGYAFTGREWDPEAGLYYYRARYYDPKRGSFVSEDPITFRGGINFYRYVNDSPVNRRDPSGLVSGNCAPVATYSAVPWSRVQDVARNPKALGVTTGRISVECECVKDGCDKWRPQVTVNAEINVLYANDTTIPPEVLRRDEAEHVTAIQAIISGTCRAGAAL